MPKRELARRRVVKLYTLVPGRTGLQSTGLKFKDKLGQAQGMLR